MTKDPQAKRKPENCAFVIFGVTGDLTHRLVMPSLYNLAAEHLLPEKFCVVGVARRGQSDNELRDSLLKGLRQFATRPVDDDIAKKLLECVTFVEADAKDPPSFDRLREHLNSLECAQDTGGNRLFYLATPPAAFAPTARELGRTGMMKENGAWRRLVIEKPFGTDLASARALNGELLKIMDEHQIYRIDHYLGKETVQNILVLRFANGMFEPIWNRNHIDHIQITVEEKLGVGHRGGFYDATGALRDMVPNHLFQLMSLVAMEPPARFDAHSVRSEKAEILTSIQRPSEEEALKSSVRAQYLAGRIGDDEIPDYRKTEDVKPGSTTETYVALKLMIDNWRWARRAVLFAHRQGARPQAHRSRDQVQAGAAVDVLRHGCRSSLSELPHDRHRTDRDHRAPVQRQDPGAERHHRRRRDEVPLWRLFPGRSLDRLRDADLRLYDRRQHPVPACRRHRSRMGGGAAVP
ncbi:glucose-6-phosphate 1-dehydrogenase [Bradyrhizobium sp. GM6.1]